MPQVIFKNPKPSKRKAQIAVEYLLLVGIVVAVVLISFKTILPRVSNVDDQGNIGGIGKDFYDKIAGGIMGQPPPAHGIVDTPPVSCGGSCNCTTNWWLGHGCPAEANCQSSGFFNICAGPCDCSQLNSSSCSNVIGCALN